MSSMRRLGRVGVPMGASVMPRRVSDWDPEREFELFVALFERTEMGVFDVTVNYGGLDVVGCFNMVNWDETTSTYVFKVYPFDKSDLDDIPGMSSNMASCPEHGFLLSFTRDDDYDNEFAEYTYGLPRAIVNYIRKISSDVRGRERDEDYDETSSDVWGRGDDGMLEGRQLLQELFMTFMDARDDPAKRQRLEIGGNWELTSLSNRQLEGTGWHDGLRYHIVIEALGGPHLAVEADGVYEDDYYRWDGGVCSQDEVFPKLTLFFTGDDRRGRTGE